MHVAWITPHTLHACGLNYTCCSPTLWCGLNYTHTLHACSLNYTCCSPTLCMHVAWITHTLCMHVAWITHAAVPHSACMWTELHTHSACMWPELHTHSACMWPELHMLWCTWGAFGQHSPNPQHTVILTHTGSQGLNSPCIHWVQRDIKRALCFSLQPRTIAMV